MFGFSTDILNWLLISHISIHLRAIKSLECLVVITNTEAHLYVIFRALCYFLLLSVTSVLIGPSQTPSVFC